MAYDHIRELDDAVDKFMESSNFLVTDDVYGDIDIETLEEATRRLDYLICQEGALPYYPCSDVVERLLHIWDYKELQYPQHMAASILSSAMFDDCCESIINEKAVPVLVKVINHSPTETTKMVVKTLTHLACKSSDHIPLIVSHGGLEAAHEFVSNCTPGTFRVVRSLAKLLAAVCRGTNLSLDKEQIAITISQNLFQKKWYTSSTTHIKEACYALTFLSYEKPAVITKEVCESIVKFLYHDDEFVVASALGVFGNIVRWGHGYQIQCLTEQCRLLQGLGESLLCPILKKFLKGDCQIISNLAVQSKKLTSIKNADDLREILYKLLTGDTSVQAQFIMASFRDLGLQ